MGVSELYQHVEHNTATAGSDALTAEAVGSPRLEPDRAGQTVDAPLAP